MNCRRVEQLLSGHLERLIPEREARAISSLNHPNICTLYDIGPNYLVMELVEGETVAARLKQIKESGTLIWDSDSNALRQACWKDMVILLRATSGKVEAYAREFDRAGIPLSASRGGLLETIEVQDLLNLLLLLDNPLQDRPLLAVLRSPFAGLTADELVQIRLAAQKAEYWTALERWHASNCRKPGTTSAKAARFLERFHRWRAEARCSPKRERD